VADVAAEAAASAAAAAADHLNNWRPLAASAAAAAAVVFAWHQSVSVSSVAVLLAQSGTLAASPFCSEAESHVPQMLLLLLLELLPALHW